MRLFLIALAVLALAAAVFEAHRRLALARLRRGVRIVPTRSGDIECARLGSGPAVLILHGGLGGWDQAAMLAGCMLCRTNESVDLRRALREGDALLRGRFAAISPSRPGYLGTPLSTGATSEAAADAMAALLDELGVARALVMGVSGGGSTAVQFALRHPDRTAALALIAAITLRHEQPSRTKDSIIGAVVFSRGFAWFLDLFYGLALLFFRLLPRQACMRLLAATETFDARRIRVRAEEISRRPEQVRWMHGLIETGYPISVRKAGLNNDLAQFASLQPPPVERFTCPTLVVHGRHDGNVPFEHAQFVADRAPGARLVVAERCGHLLWMSEDEPRVRREVMAFFSEHAAGATAL